MPEKSEEIDLGHFIVYSYLYCLSFQAMGNESSTTQATIAKSKISNFTCVFSKISRHFTIILFTHRLVQNGALNARKCAFIREKSTHKTPTFKGGYSYEMEFPGIFFRLFLTHAVWVQ